MELSLGKTETIGQDAMTQCRYFKGLMLQQLGPQPDGAYLHMRPLPDKKMEMLVICDQPDRQSFAWAKRVQEAAELMWEQVKHGERAKLRILARSYSL